jgi:glycine/serine hydroxymethyltransferase
MNVIAGAAITFKKAAEPQFVEYAPATLRNSRHWPRRFSGKA